MLAIYFSFLKLNRFLSSAPLSPHFYFCVFEAIFPYIHMSAVEMVESIGIMNKQHLALNF